ncbi:NXPE family member 3-like [Pseudoliparis swirei]|uniref:NXPE family member 3-like n=1 Tax=Pseudoliparis swirei TaxID=2059687 RepID=UPI0024BDF1B8|nr:NXPE family member 3-like [Pseudoliparis swirei]
MASVSMYLPANTATGCRLSATHGHYKHGRDANPGYHQRDSGSLHGHLQHGRDANPGYHHRDSGSLHHQPGRDANPGYHHRDSGSLHHQLGRDANPGYHQHAALSTATTSTAGMLTPATTSMAGMLTLATTSTAGMLTPATTNATAALSTATTKAVAMLPSAPHTNTAKFQPKVNDTILAPRVSSEPAANLHFCTFQPLTPLEALEERLLLDSTAWPETPALVSLQQTSDPAHSSFTILPRRRGGQWHVGDELEVMIQASDFQGRPKKSGGDFLLARLHNLTLEAGVVGQVVDHLNGSYSAVFSLLWEGDAQVEVTLVHSSEAISVLDRVTRNQPDRMFFKSLFRSDSRSQATVCNVCLRPIRPLCNFTDLRTGEPWFCYKPKNLSCDARISHFRGGFKQPLKAKEKELFQSKVNMKVSIQASGPSNVTVLPLKGGQLKVKSSTVTPGPSGYYYQGLWRGLTGTTVRHFDEAAITKCLKNKVVNMYGDSTIRQWFEYLKAALPDLKSFDLHSSTQGGPFMALDHGNNILMKFRCHGPPYSLANIPTRELRYIANEIDGLVGGTNSVVVIGIWVHLSTYPTAIYIRRVQTIRRAVVRLLDRAPGTLVFIRTANPKVMTLYESLTKSDWFSLQRDQVLRAMFKGLNVHLIDAWEMTLAHHLPHHIHPYPPIIKNMVNHILSYICPQKAG